MKIIKRKFCLVYDQMSAAAAHLLRTFIPIYFWTRSSCTPLANEHSEYFSLSARTKIEDLLWLMKFGKTSYLLPFYRIRMLNTRPLSHANTLLATSIYKEEAKKYIHRSTKPLYQLKFNLKNRYVSSVKLCTRINAYLYSLCVSGHLLIFTAPTSKTATCTLDIDNIVIR